MKTELTFDEWCDEIDRLAVQLLDWPRSLTDDAGRESWHELFAMGLSPQEALNEEVYAA